MHLRAMTDISAAAVAVVVAITVAAAGALGPGAGAYYYPAPAVQFVPYLPPPGPRDYLPPPPLVPRTLSPCAQDSTPQFTQALYDFSSYLYKKVAEENRNHFVVSQLSTWRALSALAEGAGGEAREELMSVLRLPEEECNRDQYYKLAAGLEREGEDATLRRTRALAVREDVPYNASWAEAARSRGLLEVWSMPAESAAAAAALRARLAADEEWPRADQLAGKRAVLLDSMDYRAVWRDAFPVSETEVEVPFHDDDGNEIGVVDMMTVHARVKMAHLPELGSKVLELPMGVDGRYSMLVLVPLGKVRVGDVVKRFPTSIIRDILAGERESAVPLPVSLPRLSIRTDVETGGALRALGVRRLWGERGAVGAPLDVALVRATIALGESGSRPAMRGGYRRAVPLNATGLPAEVGADFVANRPFMFGLIDKKTNTCLLTGAFSRPPCRSCA